MENLHGHESALSSEIERFRHFNRTYTRFLGTLNEGLLNSEFSLAEARVLYELANRSVPRSSEIAEALGMDAGYLSRILRAFERKGLIWKKASSGDKRSLELELTKKGKAAFQALNALSDEQARSALMSLARGERVELMRAMETIEGMVEPPRKKPKAYVLRPHRVGDMGWVVYSEALGYAEQFGWDAGFEALAAKIVGEFVMNFDAGRERCWVAEMNGQNVGHVFLVKHPTEPDTAKLRLLFVEPSARGMGLGDALVKECLRFARSVGYRKVVLWTQSILTAAHRIYQRAGFRLVQEEPHHSFGHDLIGQEWELEL
jgi:DNA-binding MarR family transcriptional regulator/GNAT superfamily N-acetyltransferase